MILPILVIIILLRSDEFVHDNNNYRNRIGMINISQSEYEF